MNHQKIQAFFGIILISLGIVYLNKETVISHAAFAIIVVGGLFILMGLNLKPREKDN